MDYINALLKKPVTRTPVWIMRQAGRYLPEYRNTRKKAGDFLALCKNPELACEVTLQPFARFDLDAAILFSDILTIPDAYGLGLYFAENEGPKFEKPLKSENDIKNLQHPDVRDNLSYVMDAVKLIRENLNSNIPLIGFSGSPWTLATYMLEGGSSKTFSKVKGLMYENPEAMHLLLTKLSNTIIDYLNAQIDSGANAIMIFDTWGGLLNTECYQMFSLSYMTKIINNLNREKNGHKIPITLFTKGGSLWLDKIAASGCDGIGLDWTIDIDKAKSIIGDKVALQGNLDPCALYAKASQVREEVRKVMTKFDAKTGHVFNLGHGISPDVNPDNVKVLVDAVHEFS